MNKHPEEVEWLKHKKDWLNLKSVAETIGVPTKALWNYCNNIHSLNSKWWEPVKDWVKKFTNVAA